MRLYTRQEFFKLQTPIIYSRYQMNSLDIEGLYLCYDFLKNNNGEIIDYGYCDLINASSLELDDGRELYMCDLAEYIEQFNEFKIDLECGQRDGCYDDSQLFIVYDNYDIDQLVNTLLQCKK